MDGSTEPSIPIEAVHSPSGEQRAGYGLDGGLKRRAEAKSPDRGKGGGSRPMRDISHKRKGQLRELALAVFDYCSGDGLNV
jgi:hypothetical protein